MNDFDSPRPSIDGSSVLITGGTGSFGRAFVKRLLADHKPRRIIIFSRDESKQYDMAQELGFDYTGQHNTPLRFFIGDVRDRARVEMAFNEVDYVIHAAALKHVPTAEYNPMECIHTNVLGAQNIVEAAISRQVKKVMALSTDKAANPLNLYGASKLAAEKIFVAANNLSGKAQTSFSVVRYGNVLGSRGSVVPMYRRLIRNGATSLPITDPRMTRFWITLDRGVSFVLSSLSLSKGGEIFVPKLPSMKITDLATALAPNLETHVIGIRPGEKLHETMVTDSEARSTIDIGDRYLIKPEITFGVLRDYADLKVADVDPAFTYSSDVNEHWLSANELNDLIAD